MCIKHIYHKSPNKVLLPLSGILLSFTEFLVCPLHLVQTSSWPSLVSSANLVRFSWFFSPATRTFVKLLNNVWRCSLHLGLGLTVFLLRETHLYMGFVKKTKKLICNLQLPLLSKSTYTELTFSIYDTFKMLCFIKHGQRFLSYYERNKAV